VKKQRDFNGHYEKTTSIKYAKREEKRNYKMANVEDGDILQQNFGHLEIRIQS